MPAPQGGRPPTQSRISLAGQPPIAGPRGPAANRPLHQGLIALALTILTACAPAPQSKKLTIAAASDLNFALAAVAKEFRAAHPEIELAVNYGSSGSFYAQIQNRAPFDVFLSADVEYPRKLATAGVGRADSLFTYGFGRIVVWVPNGSALDPERALHSPVLRKLAIANPQHAPYGRAAEAALRSMGVYESVAGKLVLGENISQTLQFAQTGAADAGIVALSLALAPAARAAGRYWEIPRDAYPRMEQGGIILKDSEAARAFRAFLISGEGRRVFKQFGFGVPGE